MVPASTQGNQLAGVQGKASGELSSEREEDGEEVEVPGWMTDDSRETVNTLEMVFLHIISAILLSKSRS
jgi:hypothetical protein